MFSPQTVAASQPDDEANTDSEAILAAAVVAMATSGALMKDAQWALHNAEAENKQERLQDAARTVQMALKEIMNQLPGQKGLNEALRSVREAHARLSDGRLLHSHSAEQLASNGSRDHDALRTQLGKACAALTAATSTLCNARSSPKQLADTSAVYAKAVDGLVLAGEALSLGNSDLTDAQRAELVTLMVSVTASCADMLMAAKQVSGAPQDTNGRGSLLTASREVQDALSNLLSCTSSTSPGVADASAASNKARELVHTLAQDGTKGLEPTLVNMTYFDCLAIAGDKARAIARAAENTNTCALQADALTMGTEAKAIAMDTVDLIEAAHHAAYLVAVSDSASKPAESGCIDASQISASHQQIRESCAKLQSIDSDQQGILEAVTVIAKHTSSLCAACKVASAKTHNPIAKQNFISLARGIASTTGALVKDIKALAAESSDENRAKVGEGIKPLLHSVEQLETLSASPEFATIPAIIAPEARAKQEPILSSSMECAQSSDYLLDSVCMMVEGDLRNETNTKTLSAQTKGLNDALKHLLAALNDNAPGRKQCDDAIETLKQVNNDIDQALLACSLGSLKTRQDNDLQGFNEGMLTTCQDITSSMDAVLSACKGEPQKLGANVSEFAELFLPLVSNAAGAASKLAKRNKQQSLLEQSKVVAQSSLALTIAARAAGGDRRDTKAHATVDNAAVQFQLDISAFCRKLEADTGEAGAMSAIVASLQRSIQALGLPAEGADGTDDDDESASAIVVNLQQNTKQIASSLPTVLSANPAELKDPMRTLAAQYNELSTLTKQLAEKTGSGENDDADVLKSSVTQLGQSLVGLANSGKNLQANPSDFEARQQLARSTAGVSDSVGNVFGALQASSRGFIACETSSRTIDGVVAELGTTAMFARAGALNADNADDSFAAHSEGIAAANERLSEAAKHMAVSAEGSQGQLGDAAKECVVSYQAVAQESKLAAMAIGSQDRGAQELLVNGAGDLGRAMQKLISATVAAVGKTSDNDATQTLTDETKELEAAMNAYKDTIKSVDDEAMRGVRSTESAAEAIRNELAILDMGAYANVLPKFISG
ncbi:hypothetical protein SARC_04713 [Sphaeroforma arctica JP610]|uniref:Uncharacterized protein n=1 Tax=Sphaeroforma arctica JP610 TaxID=667725 RepID=A0A0L0G1P1_9EUKA|nr:hypothetical protein SARC_04713 [Sphaeroforma arctica JP610]KNC83010.1 hypothetical protein SARC_04713 [Sphaeroforma arctica JP610]|eukprot:XP_014156912.1 hypothetical protein SARC_04713 [Sphaeroforma arctica JP610]